MLGRPLYITVAVQYIRSRQVTYVKDALQGIIRELVETDDLDLEASPSKVYRSCHCRTVLILLSDSSSQN